MVLVLASRGWRSPPWRYPTFEGDVLFDPAFLVPASLALSAVLMGWWLARSRHLAGYAAVVIPSFIWASAGQRIPGPVSWNIPIPGLSDPLGHAFVASARTWFLLAAAVVTVSAVRAAAPEARRWGIVAGAVVIPAAASTLMRTVWQQLEGAAFIYAVPDAATVAAGWLLLLVVGGVGPVGWWWWLKTFRDKGPHRPTAGSRGGGIVASWGLYALGTPVLVSGLLAALVLGPRLALRPHGDPLMFVWAIVIIFQRLVAGRGGGLLCA